MCAIAIIWFVNDYNIEYLLDKEEHRQSGVLPENHLVRDSSTRPAALVGMTTRYPCVRDQTGRAEFTVGTYDIVKKLFLSEG